MSKEDTFEAYMDPKLQECHDAETQFEAHEGILFDSLMKRVTEAREFARASELKSIEGITEAKGILEIQSSIHDELSAAINAMNEAESMLVRVLL